MPSSAIKTMRPFLNSNLTDPQVYTHLGKYADPEQIDPDHEDSERAL